MITKRPQNKFKKIENGKLIKLTVENLVHAQHSRPPKLNDPRVKF